MTALTARPQPTANTEPTPKPGFFEHIAQRRGQRFEHTSGRHFGDRCTFESQTGDQPIT